MPRPPRPPNPERRLQAASFYRQGRSIDFISGYLYVSPNEVRTWLREAGAALPDRNSKRKRKNQKGYSQPYSTSPAEACALMRTWPRGFA